MNIRKIWLVAVVLVVLAASSAFANRIFFLEIPAAPGDATTAGFEGQIEVLAWAWGASSAPCSTNVNYQDMSVTKYLDTASVDFWGALRDGTVFPEATLRVVEASGLQVEKSIVFSNLYLSSISTGGSAGGGRLTENVSLGFSQAVITYTDLVGGKGGGGTESVTVTIQGCPSP